MKTRKVTQASVEHTMICDGCDAEIDPRSTDQRYKAISEASRSRRLARRRSLIRLLSSWQENLRRGSSLS